MEPEESPVWNNAVSLEAGKQWQMSNLKWLSLRMRITVSYLIQVISQLLATVTIGCQGDTILKQCCVVQLSGRQALNMCWVLIDPEVSILDQDSKRVLISQLR